MHRMFGGGRSCALSALQAAAAADSASCMQMLVFASSLLALCEPWCEDACSNLNGNAAVECGEKVNAVAPKKGNAKWKRTNE